MSDRDAPNTRSAEGAPAESAPDQVSTPASTVTQTAASAASQPPEQELLCTICGLRACWQ